MEKTYVCITVSYKNDFAAGTAIHKLIEISEEDLKRCKEIVYSDKRPSKDHCIKIFSNSQGMIYGRLNKEVRSIIDSCNCMIKSECKRGDHQNRSDYHYWYCQAKADPEFHDESEIDRAINCIKMLNDRYDRLH